MTRYKFLCLSVLVALLGCWLFGNGPMVSVANAQRSNDNEEDGGRGERRWGGPEGRGFGEGRRRGFRREGSSGDNDEERPRRREERDRGRDGDGDGGSAMGNAEWAKSFIKDRDKNGNGMLEGAELEGLREPVASADRDSDKVITADEIVARIASRSNPGNSSAGGGSQRNSEQKSTTSGKSAAGSASRVYLGAVAIGGEAGDKNDASKRRTYRFTPAMERLPTTGLPSWFKSRDRNKDGQVAMSEYSRNWSERLVNEFRRYDRNNDGVVTAKEAVK
jgi:hypothetical protein